MYSVLVIHQRYKIIHIIGEFNPSYITYYTHDIHKTVREWVNLALNVLYNTRPGIVIGI
jgi:hypothetical protein